MMEPQISPLAKRLAEENSIDWRVIKGTGPEGRVIERDILTYLARIMSGEIDPPALPDASELPPSLGANPPDIGSISNLAAASAGMAREGIDLGSLLTPAPAAAPVASSPELNFNPPEPALETSPLTFNEPEPVHVPAVESAPASLEQISFGDLPSFEDNAPAAPVVLTPLETSAANFELSLETPPDAAPALDTAPALDAVPALDALPVPEVPVHIAPAQDLAPVPELEPATTPVIPASTDAWGFSPPKTVTESGVEFEIDLDGFDDLPDAPLEPIQAQPPTEPALEIPASAGFESDLVLEVPAEPVTATPGHAASGDEAHFEDNLVIDEFAPVISTQPSQLSQPDPLHDLELELDAPVNVTHEVVPEPSLEPLPALETPVMAEAEAIPEAAIPEIHVVETEAAVVTEPPVSAEPLSAEPLSAEPVSAEPVVAEEVALEPAEPVIPPSFELPVVAAAMAAPVALSAIEASPELTPEAAPVTERPVTPVASDYYKGFAVRRQFEPAALTSMQGQLSKFLHGRDVPLEVFLARAARAHLSILGISDGITLTRLANTLEPLNVPGLHHSFLEALQSTARATPGSAHGLLVLDASQFGVDDLVLPGEHPILTLNIKGGHGYLSLSGELPAASAAQFLANVAESLEAPVTLVV